MSGARLRDAGERGRTSAPARGAASAWIAALLLAAAVVGVFGRCVGFDFVDFDDPRYVSANPRLREGFSPATIAWAFTNVDVGLWIPLVWLSFLADRDLHGLSAAGCHATNVACHALAAAGLFGVLRWQTGSTCRSMLAAAVFAVHPLRAESVAWVTERKDVLSGVFTVATLAAYTWYVRRGGPARAFAVVVAFALALMTKPTVVPLPLALLALDVWPLGRWRPGDRDSSPILRTLLLEKLPLLALSAAVSVITIVGSAAAIGEHADLDARRGAAGRVVAAVVCYGDLLARLAWPVGLAARPDAGRPVPAVQAAAAALLLAAAAAVAWRLRKTRPEALMAAAWYALMLLPVSGIVGQGAESRPDRFTYLPQIGPVVALVWLGAAAGARRLPRPASVAAGLVIVAALAGIAWRQTGFWRDSITLWERTVACDPDLARGRASLGSALLERGRIDEALVQFNRAAELAPATAATHYNLARALQAAGRLDEAVARYVEAIRLRPGFAPAHNNLGNALNQAGRFAEAVAPLREALRLAPEDAATHFNLGTALLRTGDAATAVRHHATAVRLDPAKPAFHNKLAESLLASGRADEARTAATEALRLRPTYPAARLHLGRSLAALGRRPEAEAALRQARAEAAAAGDAGVATAVDEALAALTADTAAPLDRRP